jgi:hypothetical protein
MRLLRALPALLALANAAPPAAHAGSLASATLQINVLGVFDVSFPGVGATGGSPAAVGDATALTTKIAGLEYTAFGVPWAAGRVLGLVAAGRLRALR